MVDFYFKPKTNLGKKLTETKYRSFILVLSTIQKNFFVWCIEIHMNYKESQEI